MTARHTLKIHTDRDWLALNAYRMALEAIAKSDAESWECNCEEMRALARCAIEDFPGSFYDLSDPEAGG